MSNTKFYGTLKTADLLSPNVREFGSHLGAGLKSAVKSITPRSNPLTGGIEAGMEGAKGLFGSFANARVKPLEADGVSFNKDQYNTPIGVNKTQTGVNYLNNAIGGLGDKVKGLFEPGGVQNAMNGIGGFLNNNKGSILGGAALLGGGYLLKGMFTPKPRRRYSVPQGYMDQQPGVPQAFQKAAQLRKNGSAFGFMPSPMQIPQRGAELITNGLDIPGVSGELQGQKLAPTQPYQPNLKTDNAQLKKTLQDPRMRQYLTTLIQQVETNRTSPLS